MIQFAHLQCKNNKVFDEKSTVFIKELTTFEKSGYKTKK
jgi:hypothetical protein